MNERIERIINHPMRVPILTGVVSFAAGVGAGYILCLKRTEKTYTIEEEHQLEFKFDVTDLAEQPKDMLLKESVTEAMSLEERLEEAYPGITTDSDEEFDRKHAVSGSAVAEEFIASKLKEAMVSPSEEPEVEIISQSVFANDDEDWNYEEELKKRTEEEPYVLHKDEFWAEEKDYIQTTLTFYEGDRIMVDEDNVPVYNHETVTGPLKFGHGSGDPNVVYIRNDKRHAEYEVLRDTGLYSSEVLGLEIEDNARVNEELKHSTPRKFKME